MSDNYAEAVMTFESDLDDAVRHAEEAGLAADEIVAELRRYAQQFSDAQ